MESLAFFAILLTLYFASAFNPRGLVNYTLQQLPFTPVVEEKEAAFYSRITNGLEAETDHFSYQASLIEDYVGFFCGGSPISHEWVLTAAHCTIDRHTLSVFLGTINRVEPEIIYHIQRFNIITHKDFDRGSLRHDIALVNIPLIRLSNSIKPVSMPRRHVSYRKYVGATAVLAGWGVTAHLASRKPIYLPYATFKIISNEDCKIAYDDPDFIYWGKICTVTTYQIAACNGDSGGPLVLQHSNAQIGILSFGARLRCDLGLPNSFTRVDLYLDWIRRHTSLGV